MKVQFSANHAKKILVENGKWNQIPVIVVIRTAKQEDTQELTMDIFYMDVILIGFIVIANPAG